MDTAVRGAHTCVAVAGEAATHLDIRAALDDQAAGRARRSRASRTGPRRRCRCAGSEKRSASSGSSMSRSMRLPETGQRAIRPWMEAVVRKGCDARGPHAPFRCEALSATTPPLTGREMGRSADHRPTQLNQGWTRLPSDHRIGQARPFAHSREDPPHALAFMLSKKSTCRLASREGLPAFKVGTALRFRLRDIDAWADERIRENMPMQPSLPGDEKG